MLDITSIVCACLVIPGRSRAGWPWGDRASPKQWTRLRHLSLQQGRLSPSTCFLLTWSSYNNLSATPQGGWAAVCLFSAGKDFMDFQDFFLRPPSGYEENPRQLFSSCRDRFVIRRPFGNFPKHEQVRKWKLAQKWRVNQSAERCNLQVCWTTDQRSCDHSPTPEGKLVKSNPTFTCRVKGLF